MPYFFPGGDEENLLSLRPKKIRPANMSTSTPLIENLRELLSVMSPGEKNTLLQFTTNLRSGDKTDNKVQQLLLELLDGKEKLSPFHKTVAVRLKERLMESLTLDVNLNRRGVYSEATRNIVRLEKRLFAIKFLMPRKGNKFIAQQLKQIIKQAYKYELHDFLVFVLVVELEFVATSLGLEEYRSRLKELNKWKGIRDLYYEMIEFLNEIELWEQVIFGLSDQKEFVETLEAKISTFEKSPFLRFSISCQRIFLSLKIIYFQISQQPEKGDFYITQLFKILKRHRILFKKTQIAGCYFLKAQNDLYCQHWKDTLNSVQKARNNCKKGAFMFTQADSCAFYAYFYSENYEKAYRTSRVLVAGRAIRQHPLFYEQFCYFHAWSLFMRRDWQASRRYLSRISQLLLKNKSWNLHFRILSLMIHAERGALDNYLTELECLRKFVNAYKREGLDNPRAYAIYDLLKLLGKNSLDFQKTVAMSKDTLDRLASDDPAYRWMVKSPELLPFDKWLKEKAMQ